MPELDSADRLLLRWIAHSRAGETTPQLRTLPDLWATAAPTVVVWGEQVRALAAAVHRDAPEATVGMWNDFVGPEGSGIVDAAECASADLVLVRLPKSLGALEGWVAEIARRYPTATLVAAGMVKHMTLAQNDVLRRHFARLDVSHAEQKARVLVAREPLLRGSSRSATSLFDRVTFDATAGAASGLTLVAHGGVFAGARLDQGTRALLDELEQRLPADGDGAHAVDLGCGSGLVAAWLAQRGYRVRASDRSWAAVASTRATAAANGLADRIDVHWEDALADAPDLSAQLVVLNPPFHDRAAVSTDAALRMFAAAARVLVPGGELVTVWNSHLRYRLSLERTVGPTVQWTRTAKFTVTSSIRVATR